MQACIITVFNKADLIDSVSQTSYELSKLNVSVPIFSFGTNFQCIRLSFGSMLEVEILIICKFYKSNIVNISHLPKL